MESLIAICGPAGAGKSTLSTKIVINNPSYNRLPFAFFLKRMLERFLEDQELSPTGIADMLYGFTKDIPSVYFCNKTPRLAMQTLGSEWRDMIDKEFVVIGSPATVRDRLEGMVRRLNVGHLMVVLQFGSMPHELATKNIELFGREVLPHLQKIWEDKPFENAWWPKRLRHRTAKQREMATA